MFRSAFKPGDSVPEGGAYWVHHYQHRLAHLARTNLKRFPQCAQCGEKVRFEQAPPGSEAKASWLRFDVDFRDQAEGDERGRAAD